MKISLLSASSLFLLTLDLDREKRHCRQQKFAGIDVIKLLNEPTAAAIAFSMESEQKELNNRNIFVFDFGGGTLDCTVMKITSENGQSEYKVLSTFGNTHLGGVDIDNSLCKYALAHIKEQFPDEYKRCLERM